MTFVPPHLVCNANVFLHLSSLSICVQRDEWKIKDVRRYSMGIGSIRRHWWQNNKRRNKIEKCGNLAGENKIRFEHKIRIIQFWIVFFFSYYAKIFGACRWSGEETFHLVRLELWRRSCSCPDYRAGRRQTKPGANGVDVFQPIRMIPTDGADGRRALEPHVPSRLE